MRIRSLERATLLACIVSLCPVANARDTVTKQALPSEYTKMMVASKPEPVNCLIPAFVPKQETDKTPETPEAADKLEARLKLHPDDFNTRMFLLEYYYWHMVQSQPARLAHERHVLWVIRHHPEADIAGTPQMTLRRGIEDDAILEAKRLWREQMSAHPRNAKIVGNAASFFFKQELDVGFELLNRAQALEPKNPKWPEKLGDIYKEIMDVHSRTNEQHRNAAQKALLAYETWWRLTGTVHEDDTALNALPVVAFEAGDMDKAHLYATKLLELAARYDRSKFGDAIHKGNLVLGRVALRSGDMEKAKSYLLASGQTPGSPVLDSFGPNMTLAKELLEKGERQAVLDYFTLCARFWTDSPLAQWTEEVKAGKIPDFKANLLY